MINSFVFNTVYNYTQISVCDISKVFGKYVSKLLIKFRLKSFSKERDILSMLYLN